LRRAKRLDASSLAVVIITFALFALAALTQGLTHDLLLEAGVFLVSLKLIMMAYKSNVMKESIEAKLDAIQDNLARIDDCKKSNGGQL
jgi:hypothetical protein